MLLRATVNVPACGPDPEAVGAVAAIVTTVGFPGHEKAPESARCVQAGHAVERGVPVKNVLAPDVELPTGGVARQRHAVVEPTH